MDANLEKEIGVLRFKAAAVQHRCQSVLVVTELLSEYVQLAAAQQKQIDLLHAKLKAYEEKSVEPAGGTVPGTAPDAA